MSQLSGTPVLGRARAAAATVPPGPPVLQTIVAEVYGPDASRRLELARTVRSTFERTPGVDDVDWYVKSRQPKLRLEVDGEKAAAAGLSAAEIAAASRSWPGSRASRSGRDASKTAGIHQKSKRTPS